MSAFPGQKGVIAASRFFRKIAAGRGAMFVHGAVPIFLIEEHAHAFEDMIFAMPQHARLVRLFVFGEFRFGLFVRQAEAFGQPLYVPFVDPDPVVRTTIPRAFCAVVPQARLSNLFCSVCLKNRQFFFRHNLKT